ncbi:MAG: hypothetical protein R3B60_02660 [Candidatus Paceibacterota bacterium]
MKKFDFLTVLYAMHGYTDNKVRDLLTFVSGKKATYSNTKELQVLCKKYLVIQFPKFNYPCVLDALADLENRLENIQQDCPETTVLRWICDHDDKLLVYSEMLNVFAIEEVTDPTKTKLKKSRIQPDSVTKAKNLFFLHTETNKLGW